MAVSRGRSSGPRAHRLVRRVVAWPYAGRGDLIPALVTRVAAEVLATQHDHARKRGREIHLIGSTSPRPDFTPSRSSPRIAPGHGIGRTADENRNSYNSLRDARVLPPPPRGLRRDP